MDNFDLLAAPTCWSTVCIGQISPLKYYTEHVIPLTKMSFPCPEQIVQQYTSAYTPFDEITLYKNEEKIATLSPEEYTAKKKKFVSYINSEIKDMHFTLKDNLDENYMDLEYSYVRCRSKNNDKSASFGDKN